jgi:hypothetical protein
VRGRNIENRSAALMVAFGFQAQFGAAADRSRPGRRARVDQVALVTRAHSGAVNKRVGPTFMPPPNIKIGVRSARPPRRPTNQSSAKMAQRSKVIIYT